MRYAEASKRRSAVADRVTDHGHASTAELAIELGVSEMTIRRDIAQLAQRGLLEPVIGGARRHPLGVAAFDERAAHGAGSKAAIGRAAAERLEAETVALDAGTTVGFVAPHVPAGATIVTHSAPVVTAAAARDDVDLIVLGGTYQRATRSFVGLGAVTELENLVIDTAVISVTAVEGGWLQVHDPLEAAVKRAMIAAATTVILVADGSKFRSRGTIRLAPVHAVSVMVTDADGARAFRPPAGTSVVEAPQ